jgi:tRNA threonylcarbamoyl adenosine modification protein (Sua5/YciO/YrdC/YwlC family)
MRILLSDALFCFNGIFCLDSYFMSQFFSIHPENPQKRLIQQAVDIVRAGGVIVYPTDSAYALGCSLDNKQGLDRIREIRKISPDHNFTLVCRDLSDLGSYARVTNQVYRLLKANTPGAYTFILEATRLVPKRVIQPKRKTVGLRVPDSRICQELIQAVGEPIMSASLILPGDTDPLIDPYEIREILEHDVDLVIDGGFCGLESSTVVDLMKDLPKILRQGCGDITPFG